MTRRQWEKERQKGIGASEAAAVLGLSPHLNNVELWEIKTGRRKAKDISGEPYVLYGIKIEPLMRAEFALDYPEYELTHEEFEIIRHPDYPFIFATPDGKLRHRETDDKGGLECKSTEIRKAADWGQWDRKVPMHYFVQLLQQMCAAQWSFNYLKARIRYFERGELRIETRHYPVFAADHQADIDMLEEAEIRFWWHVERDIRPHLVLPPI